MFDALVAPFHYAFMQRAFVAALAVGLLCSTMGTYVVLRRLSFIGDGIAHASFAGIVIAYLRGANFYIGAASSQCVTALGIGFVSSARPHLARHDDRRALHRHVCARRLPDEPAAQLRRRLCRAFSSATSWPCSRRISG